MSVIDQQPCDFGVGCGLPTAAMIQSLSNAFLKRMLASPLLLAAISDGSLHDLTYPFSPTHS